LEDYRSEDQSDICRCRRLGASIFEDLRKRSHGELAEEWLAVVSVRPERLPSFPGLASLGRVLLGLLAAAEPPTKIDVARLSAAAGRSQFQNARRFVSSVLVTA
jgi:hypothetical protein